MLAIATIGMLSATTLSAGLLLAFTPYLMRRNECFAVTIPAFAQNDPRLAYLKKRYAVIMAIITALSTIASLAAGAFLVANEEALGVTILCTARLFPLPHRSLSCCTTAKKSQRSNTPKAGRPKAVMQQSSPPKKTCREPFRLSGTFSTFPSY